MQATSTPFVRRSYSRHYAAGTTSTPRLAEGAIALILGNLAVASENTWAHVSCVSNATELEQALVIAETSNTPSDIRVLSGELMLGSIDISMNAAARAPLSISGGWNPGCASNEGGAPTLLRGSGQPLNLRFSSGFTMQQIAIAETGSVRLNRTRDGGGSPITVDRVRWSKVPSVVLEAESSGDIDLRNLLVHDSGLPNACVMRLDTGDSNDGYSSQVLAHATFANNIGNRHLCLVGSAPRRFVRNSIFDSSVGNVSIQAEGGQVIFQRNRFNTVGGVPPDPVSAGNTSDPPQFLDPGSGDFRLSNLSSLINRGMLAQFRSSSARGLDGQPRWRGVRPDLGAFESSIEESSIHVVSNHADSGPGSLRAAIMAANQSQQSSILRFNLPNCSTPIVLNSLLPETTVPVWIDGYSQAGSQRNTSDLEFNAKLCVGIKAGMPGLAHGLRVQNSARIEGLVISGFNANGANANLLLSGASDVVIRGNQFGASESFGAADPVTTDISLGGAFRHVQIGGLALADRNLLAANANTGITMGSSAAQVEVLGNWFGIAADGSAGMMNGLGMFVEGFSHRVQGNRFAFKHTAIRSTASSAQTLVQSNVFGRAPAGTAGAHQLAVLANGGFMNLGVLMDSTVGANQLLGCVSLCVLIQTLGAIAPSGISVRGNLGPESAPNGLEIDLGAPGPTPNDPGDGDQGPNELMNHPVLSAQYNGNSYQLAGTIDTEPGTVRIDLYASPSCGLSGRGLLRIPLSTLQTDQSAFAFATGPLPAGLVFSATATNSEGSTSEASPCARSDLLFRNRFE